MKAKEDERQNWLKQTMRVNTSFNLQSLHNKSVQKGMESQEERRTPSPFGEGVNKIINTDADKQVRMK